jgi:hypothetical protein
MSDFLVVRSSPVFPRSHTITGSFVQSECTGGYLCGTAFQQNGCYATPDYSTCQFDSSLGESVCTVCICYGYDSGETGCNSGGSGSSGSSGSGSGGTSVNDLLNSSSKRSVPLRSLVIVLSLCVLSNANVFGLF